jgi:hypothetical protein
MSWSRSAAPPAGALCCLLAWYGLLAHADDQQHRGIRAADLLTAFWDENAAHDWWDLLVANPIIVGLHRLVDGGWLPAAPPLPWVPGMVKARLQRLLERLVSFEDLLGLLPDHPNHPTLLCGAADVLSGEFAGVRGGLAGSRLAARASCRLPTRGDGRHRSGVSCRPTADAGGADR